MVDNSIAKTLAKTLPHKTLSRRHALKGAGALVAGATMFSNSTATFAAGHSEVNNVLKMVSGDLTITPIDHASLILSHQDLNIYVDPVGDANDYADLPPASLVLVTHEHGDHYNQPVLDALLGTTTPLITNPAVFAKLPTEMQARSVSVANGDFTLFGEIRIDAIPAYNQTADRLNFHPKGRDNGYVLSWDGARIYIAGDTEDIPEMRALTDIDLAFVPMNLPYTMDEAQAADGTLAFAPKVVYPYHYRGSDTEKFKSLVEAGGKDIEVRLHDWYAG